MLYVCSQVGGEQTEIIRLNIGLTFIRCPETELLIRAVSARCVNRQNLSNTLAISNLHDVKCVFLLVLDFLRH